MELVVSEPSPPASCCGLRVGPTRNALRVFSVVDNESHIESLSQALSRHSVPFDPSSEMHRRGKVFGFRFVAGGVGEDEVVAEINWIA